MTQQNPNPDTATGTVTGTAYGSAAVPGAYPVYTTAPAAVQTVAAPAAAAPAAAVPAAEEQQSSGISALWQSNTGRFAMGVAAGAAVAYILANKRLQQGVTATGGKAWSAVRGEVEELRERLEDTQAELEYYRNLHKGEDK